MEDDEDVDSSGLEFIQKNEMDTVWGGILEFSWISPSHPILKKPFPQNPEEDSLRGRNNVGCQEFRSEVR